MNNATKSALFISSVLNFAKSISFFKKRNVFGSLLNVFQTQEMVEEPLHSVRTTFYFSGKFVPKDQLHARIWHGANREFKTINWNERERIKHNKVPCYFLSLVD